MAHYLTVNFTNKKKKEKKKNQQSGKLGKQTSNRHHQKLQKAERLKQWRLEVTKDNIPV